MEGTFSPKDPLGLKNQNLGGLNSLKAYISDLVGLFYFFVLYLS